MDPEEGEGGKGVSRQRTLPVPTHRHEPGWLPEPRMCRHSSDPELWQGEIPGSDSVWKSDGRLEELLLLAEAPCAPEFLRQQIVRTVTTTMTIIATSTTNWYLYARKFSPLLFNTYNIAAWSGVYKEWPSSQPCGGES